jgi:ABC-type transport system involved in multi-copper enzyme maturation permease subunit
MNDKVARRRIDGTSDFLILLVPIIILAPFLVVIPIVCLVGAVLDSIRTSTSFNQRGYLRGQKVTGTIISLSGNERRRGLTLKEEGTTYNDIDRRILTS